MSRAEERLWERARAYIEQGNADAARITLQSLLQRAPDNAAVHLQLGAVEHAEGRLQASATHALDAARRMPDDAASILRIVQALLRVGEIVAARECLLHPTIARCSDGRLLAQFAGVRQQLGEHGAALELLERARAAGHDGADFRYILAVQLMFNGRTDEAEAELDACLRMGTTYGRAAVTLARVRRQTAQSNHVDAIRTRLRTVEAGSEDHAAFEYALYKELEDLGDFDAAWAALERGAALMYARLRHDPAAESRIVDALIALCGADFVAGGGGASDDGAQPIFIVGMPRSGTTVLERILGNHPAVTSAGELGDFARAVRFAADHATGVPIDRTILERAPRIDWGTVGRRYLEQTRWRADGAPRYVDKLPINWLQAGFIARALPQARILHMVRDPLDTCFSNFRAYFGPGYGYSYEMGALAAHYRDYRRLLAHWHAVMPGRILDVDYARLVEDPATVASEVFAFCGLDDEPGCVDLARNASPSATLSSAQVREPIHRRSLGEWRRYERQLQPLRAALGAAIS